MPEDFLNMLKVASSAVAGFRIKSAMTPMTWFACVTGPLCLALAGMMPTPELQVATGVMGLIILALTLICFVYFALAKPDYLRSEEYQIQKQSLELIGSKNAELEACADHVVLIANPENKETEPS